jgi:hypothetical protein
LEAIEDKFVSGKNKNESLWLQMNHRAESTSAIEGKRVKSK